jgi:hypothetical protein
MSGEVFGKMEDDAWQERSEARVQKEIIALVRAHYEAFVCLVVSVDSSGPLPYTLLTRP